MTAKRTGLCPSRGGCRLYAALTRLAVFAIAALRGDGGEQASIQKELEMADLLYLSLGIGAFGAFAGILPALARL